MSPHNTSDFDIENAITALNDGEICTISNQDHEENYDNNLIITKSISSDYTYHTSYELNPDQCADYIEKYDNLVYLCGSSSLELSIQKSISEHIVDLDVETASTATHAETDTDADTEIMENLDDQYKDQHDNHDIREQNKLDDKYFSSLKKLNFILFIVGISATGLSILGRHSYFARLQYPMHLDEAYLPVLDVGLFEIKACSSSRRATNIMRSNYNTISDKKSEYVLGSTSTIFVNKTSSFITDEGCNHSQIYISTSHDLMWNLSRFFNSLSLYFSLITTFLFATWFFDSLRVTTLKSISIGQLLTYFISSLSFLFFESDLCHEHGCLISNGSIYLMCSCFLWFVTGICVLKISEQIR